METVSARGQSFVFAREFVIATYGEGTFEKVVGGLAPEAAAVWAGSLLVTGIYPFSSFKAFIDELAKVTGHRSDAELSRIYRHIADQSLNRLYKVFLRFSNPAFVIRNYPTLWSRFFTSGEVTVAVAEKGHARLVFVLPEVFLDWLSPACLGFSAKAVELAGGSGLVLREERKTRTGPDQWEVCYDLTWDE